MSHSILPRPFLPACADDCCGVCSLNSMLLFPFFKFAERYFAQPSLLLHDKQNRLVTLQNDAGMGNLTVPDWGQAAAREIWWEELRNYTSTGLIDGAAAAAHFGEDWLFE